MMDDDTSTAERPLLKATTGSAQPGTEWIARLCHVQKAD